MKKPTIVRVAMKSLLKGSALMLFFSRLKTASWVENTQQTKVFLNEIETVDTAK